MERYIAAEKAKQAMREMFEQDCKEFGVEIPECFPATRAIEVIDNIPTADVEEVRHGRWLLEREPDGTPYCFHCSVCDEDFTRISIMCAYPICPWCGAKMDQEGEAEK